jgi:3-isopropylmalate dehydrogenase
MTPCQTHLIGVLKGEGIGPEVITAALRVLDSIEAVNGKKFERRYGGPIGRESELRCGEPLSEEVASFCQEVFQDGGALLCGPGSGRFVYDLRRRFDLYYKLSPLKPCPQLRATARLRPEYVHGVDVLIVRDNAEGIYQGSWRRGTCPADGQVAEHTFRYTEHNIRRVMEVAARKARGRKERLGVVVKDGGVPTVSSLWREVAADVAAQHGVSCSFINLDHAAYRLIQHGTEFDVLVTPNLCGDVLADLGAVLLGSRGLSFSGNFSSDGRAVYQTNHGSAYDLVGTNRANPVGQFYSLAMLLRESFGLHQEARWIEEAVADVWRRGWRTDDLEEPGCCGIGTRELTEQVVQSVPVVAHKENAV